MVNMKFIHKQNIYMWYIRKKCIKKYFPAPSVKYCKSKYHDSFYCTRVTYACVLFGAIGSNNQCEMYKVGHIDDMISDSFTNFDYEKSNKKPKY